MTHHKYSSTFPDITVRPDEIDIQGRVVGVYQEL